ncbi:MAG: coenzyme F420-0:L-glutamate ligase [Candidatus Korarchaeota archaeon]|nr:coenzyme F420-0:L-glutamate ligase [Candidatus Korarchaeota archaeon]
MWASGGTGVLRVRPIGPIDPPIGIREDYLARLDQELDYRGIHLSDGEVIAVASKVVSYSQGRVVPISRWSEVSDLAKRIAEHYGAEPWKTSAVLEEADLLLGGYRGYLFTYKNGIPVGSAGIDRSNSPPGYVVLHPVDPDGEARRIVEWFLDRRGVAVGAIIVDSRLTLFRRGVIGVALGVWGLKPLRDLRGKPDIYGKPLRFTVVNVADSLAASAALVMGESAEKIPFALIDWEGVEPDPGRGGEDLRVDPGECYIYNSLLNPPPRSLLGGSDASDG